MKKITTLFALLLTSVLFAQAPQKMSYQAVVRNASNNLVVSQAVGMKISILQGSATGTAVYTETQNATSNTNGLVSLEIGGGTVVTGTFATINWANGPYFIKTETDPTGGTNYTITGTSQLLSVPFALYAATSGSTSAWGLTGNAGTSLSTNFIGTTDNIGINFRTNNITRWSISQNGRLFNQSVLGNNSLFISAGNETTTGASNTAVGTGALVSNTTGNNNAAFGESVLAQNLTGFRNTAIGNLAMNSNTDGLANVAVGFSALLGNTIGNTNTAIGQNALFSNTTGSNNTALGFQANVSTNNLSNATAIGANATVNASNKIRLGDNNVTATDIAGQVKVNAQSTTADFTLPTTRGTANQVLTTDGAGATSWATASGGGSGAQVALLATKTANAQVLALANGTNTGDLVTFDNIVTSNNTYGTYNTSTNTFTVNQTGVYQIQSVTRSPDATPVTNTVNQFLFIDIDNAGILGVNNIITEYQPANNTNFPSGIKGKGFTSVMLYLTVGQTISIKGLSANSSTTSQGLKTDGSCKLMIFKM